MKNGICRKCRSNELVGGLHLRGGEGHIPFVEIHEPEPEKNPLVWMPKSERSHVRVYTWGASGHMVLHAKNCAALNEDHRKGHKSE